MWLSLRKIATLGGVGIAGLALIGAGATATFTQDTDSIQTVTGGTMNVVLSANGASGNNTATISLPAVGPVSSSFVGGPNEVTITNAGNIPINEIGLQVSDTNNNATLQSETWVCFYSDGSLFFNEPLTTVETYGLGTVAGTVAAGATDTYTLVLYAGSQNAGCGATYTGFSGGQYGNAETFSGSTPGFGLNPAAASLTNPAQGGTLNVDLKITYQG
jgi:hypothetical protein